jgi:hypothetical protein
MTTYIRPRLTQTEEALLIIAVREFFSMHRPQQIEMISRLMVENALLTREVNEHRAARGFEPLPTYIPPRQKGQIA